MRWLVLPLAAMLLSTGAAIAADVQIVALLEELSVGADYGFTSGARPGEG